MPYSSHSYYNKISARDGRIVRAHVDRFTGEASSAQLEAWRDLVKNKWYKLRQFDEDFLTPILLDKNFSRVLFREIRKTIRKNTKNKLEQIKREIPNASQGVFGLANTREKLKKEKIACERYLDDLGKLKIAENHSDIFKRSKKFGTDFTSIFYQAVEIKDYSHLRHEEPSVAWRSSPLDDISEYRAAEERSKHFTNFLTRVFFDLKSEQLQMAAEHFQSIVPSKIDIKFRILIRVKDESFPFLPGSELIDRFHENFEFQYFEIVSDLHSVAMNSLRRNHAASYLEKKISKENKKNRQNNLRAQAAKNTKDARSVASSQRTKLLFEEQKKSYAKCPYCQKTLGTFSGKSVAHLDHIYPVSKGGLSTKQNLVFICSACNAEKRDMTLGQFIKKTAKERDEIEAKLDLLGKDY